MNKKPAKAKGRALEKAYKSKQRAKVKAKPKKSPAKPAPREIIVTGRAQTIWPREVEIGARHRKDMGDLVGLARSIDERGCLLQPIVLNPQHKLIGGQRRMAAWALSRFRDAPIPCHIVDVDSIVCGEWDENAQRKNFTPEEAVALKRELEPELRRRALEMEAARPPGSRPAPGRKGNAEDRVGRLGDNLARFLGKSRRTIERAEKVIDAAAADPKLRPLVDQMNATEKVNAAYKKVEILKQVADIATNKANGTLTLPAGQFDVIIADMPWPYETDDDNPAERGRAARDYPTMAIKDMKALPIGERCAKNCVLWFWAVNFHMETAYTVLRAWGFTEFPTILTWGKDRFGKGQRLRNQTEHCIAAIKGKPVWHLTNQSTLLRGPSREDSRKPDEFYALVDAVTPSERGLELFPRREMPAGWESYGDQVGLFKDDPWKTAEFSDQPFIPPTGFTELTALEAIADPLALHPTPEWLDKLIANKWIIGRKKPRLSKLGFDALERLRAGRPLVDVPPPRQIDLEEAIAAKSAVDCRVCAAGSGLCAQCIAAETHTVTMTNDEKFSIATCRCGGWRHVVPWGDDGQAQERAVRDHWRAVVFEAQAA